MARGPGPGPESSVRVQRGPRGATPHDPAPARRDVGAGPVDDRGGVRPRARPRPPARGGDPRRTAGPERGARDRAATARAGRRGDPAPPSRGHGPGAAGRWVAEPAGPGARSGRSHPRPDGRHRAGRHPGRGRDRRTRPVDADRRVDQRAPRTVGNAVLGGGRASGGSDGNGHGDRGRHLFRPDRGARPHRPRAEPPRGAHAHGRAVPPGPRRGARRPVRRRRSRPGSEPRPPRAVRADPADRFGPGLAARDVHGRFLPRVAEALRQRRARHGPFGGRGRGGHGPALLGQDRHAHPEPADRHGPTLARPRVGERAPGPRRGRV